MYIDAGQGQTIPGDKMFMSTETSCHFGHCYMYKFQKYLFEVWFYTIFFKILYMYIAPGQGLTTPWGRHFDVNRNILSLRSFVASFKKKNHNFIHVYSPGAGADSSQGTKFWCQQKCLVTSLICCKFQTNVFELWFSTIFFRQGQTVPRVQNFDVNRKALSLYLFVASFKEISLKSDFIQFLSWFNTCI